MNLDIFLGLSVEEAEIILKENNICDYKFILTKSPKENENATQKRVVKALKQTSTIILYYAVFE